MTMKIVKSPNSINPLGSPEKTYRFTIANICRTLMIIRGIAKGRRSCPSMSRCKPNKYQQSLKQDHKVGPEMHSVIGLKEKL